MICQACGIEAPTKRVTFYQNIGALVMRFSKTAEGNFCKSCVHETFWKFTLTSLVLGWWGIISLIVNTFFILNNVIRYVFCLGMPSVPPDAVEPRLTDAVVDRLGPYTDDIISRLNDGDDFETVAEATAMKANVTKGEVALYVHALIAASEDAQ